MTIRINSLDGFQLIIAVISGIGLVLLAIRRLRKDNTDQNGSPRLVVGMHWILIGMIAINLGWVGGRWLADQQKPSRIFSPVAYQPVDMRVLVTGRSVEPSSGYALWLVVENRSSLRYIPASTAAILQTDGSWSSLAFVGSDLDQGRSFDLLVVMADPTAQSIFTKYTGENSSDGLKELPPGCQVVDQITVTRK